MAERLQAPELVGRAVTLASRRHVTGRRMTATLGRNYGCEW